MNFLKKNMWSLGLLVFAVFCLAAPDAFAQADQLAGAKDGTVFGTAADKATSAFRAVRTIIFIVGGFGLVALAFFAVFGKLKWTWFASLAVGLAILAAAGAIIDYATTTGGTGGVTSKYEDTLVGSRRTSDGV